VNLIAAARATTFRSLRHRDYRLYFSGQIVSVTGSWMQSTALMWFVYDHTGNPAWPPLLLTAQVGPTLLLGAYAGAVADRVTKKKLILCTQLLFFAVAVGLTALFAVGLAAPELVFAAALLNGIIQAFDLPARLAYVPHLIPKDDLINAIGLNSLLFNAARAVGPALAGQIFLAVGEGEVARGTTICLAVNVASYGAVLLALLRIRVAGTPAGDGTNRGHWLDGMRYVKDRPRLAALVLLTGAFSTFAWPTLTLLPAYTRLELFRQEKSYSILLSGLGLGALAAAVTSATFSSVARRRGFLLGGSGLGAAGLLALALVPVFVPAIAACAALGFGLILYLSTGQSTMQLDVPPAVRGRVMALWAMTLSASAPLGQLTFGSAATVMPVSQVLLMMSAGVVVVFAGLVAVTRGGFRTTI
jgi:MFS family permease